MKGEEKEIFHSKSNMTSYGFGSLSREFVQMAFNVLVFFYYETELGLDVLLIGLGLVIFAIYNAINDPIIGYLTNRPFSFTKKWGRRMPWLLIGGIPLGFSYFLVFTPPTTDPIGGAGILFGWLVFTTCLFDTLHSLFFVNFQSLFPDKFRSVEERRTATGVQIFLGVIGIAIGSILPPLIYKYGDLTSYIVQALVVCFITLISFVFAIPGFREDPKMIDQYLKSVQGVSRRASFFNTTKNAFKQKAFVAYMILYTMYWVIINSMQSSLPYVVRYTLKMPASATTLIMAGLLVGIMCSIPLWVKVSHKINDNRKIMLIGAVLMGIYAIPLIFLDSYIGIIINVIIWGTAQGAYWVMIFPVMSDVIDESVVLYKKREEGTYIGIQQFFGRMGLIGQILSFTIVHELTGFVEGADTQSPLAIWGIHVHLALVPMIAIFVGAFAFWRLFNLKPEKVMEHQQLIRTLKL